MIVGTDPRALEIYENLKMVKKINLSMIGPSQYTYLVMSIILALYENSII